jgi:hypothetical protein
MSWVGPDSRISPSVIFCCLGIGAILPDIATGLNSLAMIGKRQLWQQLTKVWREVTRPPQVAHVLKALGDQRVSA